MGLLIDFKRMMGVENAYSLGDQRIVIEHHAEHGVPGTSPPVVNVPIGRIGRPSRSGIGVFTPQPSPKAAAA
jgi:hypothetical protein